jgi:hypothetical protein
VATLLLTGCLPFANLRQILAAAAEMEEKLDVNSLYTIYILHTIGFKEWMKGVKAKGKRHCMSSGFCNCLLRPANTPLFPRFARILPPIMTIATPEIAKARPLETMVVEDLRNQGKISNCNGSSQRWELRTCLMNLL